ncbi:MAG: hypothetical protein ACYST0_07100 [Planctomycetota bacterium]|jgi:hypothetical protein
MAVAFALWELVMVPVGLMVLILIAVPGAGVHDAHDAHDTAAPASVDTQHLAAPVEPVPLLLADPGHRSGPKGPAAR